MEVRGDIMQSIMKRKLGLFGHICRMDDKRKIKTVMLGSMAGGNRQGRPCREWADDIRDWCGKDIHSLSNLARNREMWKVVTKCALDQ